MEYRLFFTTIFLLVLIYFVFLLYKSKGSFELRKTLSQNLSVNKASFYSFMAGLLILSTAYLHFAFNFANDFLSMPWQFLYMSIAFSFLLVLIAVINENHAKYGPIHRMAAFSLAFLMR